jgi:hypothetical protein
MFHIFRLITVISICFSFFPAISATNANVNQLSINSSIQRSIRQRTVRLSVYNQDSRQYVVFCSGYLQSHSLIYSASHCFHRQPTDALIRAEVFNPVTGLFVSSVVRGVELSLTRGDDSARVHIDPLHVDFISSSLPVAQNTGDCDQTRPFLSAGYGVDDSGHGG